MESEETGTEEEKKLRVEWREIEKAGEKEDELKGKKKERRRGKEWDQGKQKRR